HSFDHVFSDFGGLNCTSRLNEVLSGIDHVLRPGGRCTLVIMPRVSPWELVDLLRGNGRFALRRFRTGGVPAQLEGITFTCYYHDASAVRHGLRGYRRRSLMALSLFVPPPHLGSFARRHPKLVRALQRVEVPLSRWPVLRGWGDHFAIT